MPFSRGSSWHWIELGSPSLQADSLLSEPPGNWNDVSIVSLWLLHPVPKITFIIPSGRGRPPLFPVSISRISVLQSFWLKTTVSSLIPPFLHCPHNQIQTNCITYKFFIINSAEIWLSALCQVWLRVVCDSSFLHLLLQFRISVSYSLPNESSFVTFFPTS